MPDWMHDWAWLLFLAPPMLLGAVMKIREWRRRRRSVATLMAALETASRGGPGVHHGDGYVVHKHPGGGARIEYDPHR